MHQTAADRSDADAIVAECGCRPIFVSIVASDR